MKINKRILVTGSNGFIGSRLIDILSEMGISVYKADLKSGVDLCDPQSFSKLPNIDILVHLAAIKSVPESFKDPWKFLMTNYSATLGALEICRKNNARMIHISSYVYGSPQYIPIDEDHPLSPHNPYAQSKKASEDLCYGYQRDFGVPVTILRPFNIYGAGLRDDSLIPSIIRQLPTGQIEMLDSEPKRDYLYIDDLCQAIIRTLTYVPHGVETFNLGSGSSKSVLDVAKMIVSLSGFDVQIVDKHKRRKEEVMNCIADIDKATNLLGWVPTWSMERGLKTILEDWGIHDGRSW